LKVYGFFTITEFEILFFVKSGEIIDLNNDSYSADYGVDIEDRVCLEFSGNLFGVEYRLSLMSSFGSEFIIF